MILLAGAVALAAMPALTSAILNYDIGGIERRSPPDRFSWHLFDDRCMKKQMKALCSLVVGACFGRRPVSVYERIVTFSPRNLPIVPTSALEPLAVHAPRAANTLIASQTVADQTVGRVAYQRAGRRVAYQRVGRESDCGGKAKTAAAHAPAGRMS